MAAPSRAHAAKLLHLPAEVIQLIVDHLWPEETTSLLIAVPKLAYLVTVEQLWYQDGWGYTILHCAVDKNDEAIANLIARPCAQGQVATCQGYTPLCLTISEDDNKTAKMLINANFDLLAQDRLGRTPLHAACSESCRDNNPTENVQLSSLKG